MVKEVNKLLNNYLSLIYYQLTHYYYSRARLAPMLP